MQKFRFDEQGPFLLPKHYGPADQQDVELPWETQRCSVQVIRSTASWSGGLLPHHVETSIQQSYIDLIRESKHYVYLEVMTICSHSRFPKDFVENPVGWGQWWWPSRKLFSLYADNVLVDFWSLLANRASFFMYPAWILFFAIAVNKDDWKEIVWKCFWKQGQISLCFLWNRIVYLCESKQSFVAV